MKCLIDTYQMYNPPLSPRSNQGVVTDGVDSNCFSLEVMRGTAEKFMHCATTVTQVLWQESASVIKEWHSKSWKDISGSSSLSPEQRNCNNECVCFELDKRTKFYVKSYYFNCKNRKNTLEHAFAKYSIWKI